MLPTPVLFACCTAAALHLLVTKGVNIPFRGKKYNRSRGRSRFLTSPTTGTVAMFRITLLALSLALFYNSVGVSFRTKFELVKF